MTPEQQRIAIAEACGWFDIWTTDYGAILGKHEPESMGRDYLDVPDYLTDLNAMHEAEKRLVGESETWDAYEENLMLVYGRGHYFRRNNLLHATAAQRAEAFLRTLNLWKP